MQNRSSSRPDFARWLVLATAVLQILTPLLPSVGVGEPIGARSDSVRTLITPAGWAFSIWAALYTGSLLFAVYQALPNQHDNRLLADIRWPAAGAFFGNALWAAYTQSFGLSLISAAIIVFILGNLLVVLHRLRGRHGFHPGERWLAVLPLSALAAWLTAATIVNVAAALRFHGVDAGTAAPAISAAVVVIGGLVAGAALLRARGNPAYALVFLWALAAIYAAGGQEAVMVAVAVAAAAVAVVAGAILGMRRGGAAVWRGTPANA